MSERSTVLWPTPQAHDATGPRGKNNTFSDSHYYPHDLATAVLHPERRMWPTPNVPNGGRKPKGGTMSATGMTPDGKKRQVGLENAVTMTFAEPVSNQLTLFAEAFPASPTPWLVVVADLPTSATSGPRSPDSFASLNPDGSWRKTSQGYSQVMLDGSLAEYSATWPRAGMTLYGKAYRLAHWEPSIAATASGLWPTSDTHQDGRTLHNVEYRGRSAYSKEGVKRTVSLENAIKMTWATPTSNEHKVGRVSTNGRQLTREVWDAEGLARDTAQPMNGALNPAWVEVLMGYPRGWTEV